MYTLANKPYVLSSGHSFALFFDKIDENYRKLKEERFECIKRFMFDKITHMSESHYRLTAGEKDVIKTSLDSLLSIKEQLQDADK
jgi:hypothetical protein